VQVEARSVRASRLPAKTRRIGIGFRNASRRRNQRKKQDVRSVPLKFYNIADRGLRVPEAAGAWFSGCIMLLTMFLMSLDAFLRYFFNAPMQWQYALTSMYLLPAIVCPALAWGFRTGGFIRVSELGFLPPTIKQTLLRAGLLLSFFYVAILAWKSGGYFIDVLSSGEVAITTLRWPVWLSWVWVPTGLWLLSARLLLETFAPAHDLDLHSEPAEEI
jgi:TRAP-type C4-dicarboxylate transport system permease small subunit